MLPDFVLLFGFTTLFAVKTRRLERQLKDLKEKLNV
jgi:hypothetical protein